MSFSGLKTAVATLLREVGPADHADVAAEFEQAVADLLCSKAMRALDQTGFERLVVAGGVGANLRLRACLDAACAARGARVCYPPLRLCTDNGAMIAYAAGLRLAAGGSGASATAQPLPRGGFNVRPRWDLAALQRVGAPRS